MTLTPEALESAVRKGDPQLVRELLRGADEAQRKACAPAMKALASVGRDSLKDQSVAWNAPGSAELFRLAAGREAAVELARLGTMSGAAAVASFARSHMSSWTREHPAIAVLLDRSPSWLPDVVTRLAEFPARDSWDSSWTIVEELRSALGMPRPTSASYLRGLVLSFATGWSMSEQHDLPQLLRDDAELRSLMLDVLQLPDIGAALTTRDKVYVAREAGGTVEQPAPREQTWSGAVVGLAADGLLDRAELLDTVVDVLLRGGRRDHLNWFLRLLDEMAPTDDEVPARLRSFVRLLGDGSGPTATLAQQALRSLDDAGLIDVDTVLEAAEGALARPDKAIALAQLTWLERVAGRDGIRVDDVALAAATGFGHERRDIQERSLAAVRKMVRSRAVSAETIEELRARAVALPATLHPEAAEVLGGPLEVEALPEMATQPGPLPAAEPGVRNLGELAEAVAQYLETADLRVAERVLDGVATLAGRDHVAFAAAMAPLSARLGLAADGLHGSLGHAPARDLLFVLLRHAPERRGLRSLFSRGTIDLLEYWRVPRGAAGCLSVRAREVASYVRHGGGQQLLARPATVIGTVDPDFVVHELERAASSGIRTWPLDLEQAWLRIPRESVDAPLLDRLVRCPLPAAQWLRGVLSPETRPEPRFVSAEVPQFVKRWGSKAEVKHAGGPVVDIVPLTIGTSLRDHSLFVHALNIESLAEHAAREWWERASNDPLQVLLTMPSNREVAAAHLAADAVSTDRALSESSRECLALLPDAGGPTGLATALALGYAAGNSDAATRTAAADALLGFAARGGLDSRMAGTALGNLLTRNDIKPRRVAAVLAEVTRGPAPARVLVWELLREAIPPLLAAQRKGSSEILAVAAEAAASTGARGSLPGLDELADAGGSTRLAVEGRRLRDALTR